MNTLIQYLYRDAENNKVHNACVVEGDITDEEIEDICGSLKYGELFIPEDVGLPEQRFDDYDSDIDHPWFELQADGFELTSLEPTVSMSTTELAKRFISCKEAWSKK